MALLAASSYTLEGMFYKSRTPRQRHSKKECTETHGIDWKSMLILKDIRYGQPYIFIKGPFTDMAVVFGKYK